MILLMITISITNDKGSRLISEVNGPGVEVGNTHHCRDGTRNTIRIGHLKSPFHCDDSRFQMVPLWCLMLG